MQKRSATYDQRSQSLVRGISGFCRVTGTRPDGSGLNKKVVSVDSGDREP